MDRTHTGAFLLRGDQRLLSSKTMRVLCRDDTGLCDVQNSVTPIRINNLLPLRQANSHSNDVNQRIRANDDS